MCVMCVGTLRSQKKRVSDPLQLDYRWLLVAGVCALGTELKQQRLFSVALPLQLLKFHILSPFPTPSLLVLSC